MSSWDIITYLSNAFGGSGREPLPCILPLLEAPGIPWLMTPLLQSLPLTSHGLPSFDSL